MQVDNIGGVNTQHNWAVSILLIRKSIRLWLALSEISNPIYQAFDSYLEV